jgi:hypothetical protein
MKAASDVLRRHLLHRTAGKEISASDAKHLTRIEKTPLRGVSSEDHDVRRVS